MKNQKLIVFYGILIAFGFSYFCAESFAEASNSRNSEEPRIAELVNSAKSKLGELLLTDSFLKTLYVFDLDLGQASPKCSGDCALIWPPYLVT